MSENKNTLEVLSIPMIPFLNLAHVRTAIFRVKPDSHFLDRATEIDAPQVGNKQHAWENSQVCIQRSPVSTFNTLILPFLLIA